MFGYIIPAMSALTEAQQERYRAYYCGVCRSLRLRCGQTGRLSLSNDMTFLALLLSSLYEPETDCREQRCAIHPLKPRKTCSSRMIDYAAEMNILLFYYKCEDARRDDRSLPGLAGEKVFRRSLEQIQVRYPAQSEEVRSALEELWAEEQKETPSPDRLCNLSGEMLQAVFAPEEDLWTPVLRALGAGLGRFVYWMDAWDDLKADERKRRFNPLREYRDRPDFENFCRETLEMLIAEAAEAFEMLPLEQDLPILRNILYSGVWQKYQLKAERTAQKRKRKEEGADGE